ncbi:alpha/beta fold family hydrolase [Galdieria sulphuraria]|uniref:Alpha/beta fold family hydrolase n=1 Tax=Galdieria sulphuraria TaxID=130081 RepID=M2XT38_GALSU|nr:alpha/beta fold family hydrolase [Galdieria sulphuraria]EME26818.1 alpha/beta fold family hydrolase [Galdieria sulphuraria]|eukprot:XP_005703338.1 alpha/beta fold family hydrolase [Galdieria sulphuraria]
MNCAFLTSCDCVLRRNWFRSFSVNRKFTRNIKSLKRIYLSIQADSSQVDKTLLESDLALKYFQYKGFRTSYIFSSQNSETSDKLAIVCVHGFGATCGHWKHNIPYLSKVFGSVYAVDLLGFGASDKPSPVRTSVAYTFEEWAAQVNAFVKEVVQKPVILIANSIGCIVAMQAAVESPENYIGLVALNPSLRLLSKKKRRGLKALFATCIAALLRFQPVSTVFFKLLTRETVIRRILEQAYYDKSRVSESLVKMLWKPSKEPGAQEVFVEFTNYSEGATPEELLDKLRLPVAILWGENDPWEPVTLGMNLKQFPCVRRFITLPKVGHCPHDEAPEVVNPLLEDTIKDFMSSR